MHFKSKFQNARSSLRAVSMLETAITLPIFVLVVLFFIDISRYFIIYIGLNYAAYSAVDYASKIEVETATYGPGSPASRCNTSSCRCTPIDCAAYIARVQRILNRATDLARIVAHPSAPPGTGFTTRLLSASHYVYPSPPFPVLYSGIVAGPVADAAFLRPGERAIFTNIDGSIESIEHSTRNFTFGWPFAGENWAQILAAEPLEVRFRLNFDWITPFIPDTIQDVRAHGFRDVKAFGVDASPSTPVTPTPVPPPPTPTSTFTPFGAPTATPLPTGTVTPTPVNTNTPVTVTFNCANCSDVVTGCTGTNRPFCNIGGYCNAFDCVAAGL